MESNCRFLFVYGTLRVGRNHPMAAFLAEHARFVAEGKASGRLVDLGSYPGMVESESSDVWVPGDVFELRDPESTLATLDRYESCDGSSPLYIRRQTQVTISTGEKLISWF